MKLAACSNIDLHMLYNAINFYKDRGYEMLTAPMCVGKEAILETLPDNCFPKEHINGLYYVGSGEQSLYEMINQNPNEKCSGSYMILTPCQRDDEPDETHFEIFLKLELISFDDDKDIVGDAYEFFLDVCCDDHIPLSKLKIVRTETGNDIELDGVEIGSYGSNFYKGHKIKYGTGLAMPRTSQAIYKALGLYYG